MSLISLVQAQNPKFYLPLDDAAGTANPREISGLTGHGAATLSGTSAYIKIGAPDIAGGSNSLLIEPSQGGTEQPGAGAITTDSDRFVNLPHHADYNVADIWTVMCIFRPAALDQGGTLINKPNNFSIQYINGNSTANAINNGGLRIRMNATDVATSSAIITNALEWWFVAATKNGATSHIYAAPLSTGVLSDVTVAGTNSTGTNNTSAVQIGAKWQGGRMAHAALFATDLSMATLQTFATAAARPKSSTRKTKYGLHTDRAYEGSSTTRAAEDAAISLSRPSVVRTSCLWDQIEAGATQPGSRDFSTIDSVINSAIANGSQVHLVDIRSPQWAIPGVSTGWSNWQMIIPGNGFATDTTFQTWLTNRTNYLTALVNHVKDRVKIYELGNEPNLAGFWSQGVSSSGRICPETYIAYANAASAAIKAADPTATVYLGGLSSFEAASTDLTWGNVTSATTTTITDSAKSLTTNALAGRVVRIISGTGSGQSGTVASNTATVITLSAALTTAPDATSKYVIEGAASSGKVYFQYLVDNGLDGSHIDCVGLHPYTDSQDRGPLTRTKFENNFDAVSRMFDLMHRNGLRGGSYSWLLTAHLALTEFGWDATAAGSQANQSSYVTQALQTIRDYYGSYVDTAVIFVDHDRSGFATGGLYTDYPSLSPKPAATAFQAFMQTVVGKRLSAGKVGTATKQGYGLQLLRRAL